MKTNPNDPISADPGRAATSTFSNQDPLALPMGLSKREYFAALVMANLSGRAANFHEFKEYANCSVQIADALIYELNKEVPSA